MLHKVYFRTDVWLGNGPDGEPMRETTKSTIREYSDEAVDNLLAALGAEREDVRVQQVVRPDGEGQMTVIEIHYAQECEHDWVDVSYHEMACDECGAVRYRL